MCEICWRMRCPRACPGYDAANARRRRTAAARKGVRLWIREDANGLENRMNRASTWEKKGGVNAEK